MSERKADSTEVQASQAAGRRLLTEAQQHLRDGRLPDAANAVAGALALAPADPEVLRLHGVISLRRGDHREALRALRAAIQQLPAEVELFEQLARAQLGSGDAAAALVTLRRACEAFPDSALAWFNLAAQLKSDAHSADALAPFERCVALAPDNRVARVMFGDVLANLGRRDEAIAQYREVLRTRPDTGHAWWGLANLKTLRLDASDTAQMTAQMQRADLPEQHRRVMGFALAKACEDQGRYAEAYAALIDANARMRRIAPWNAAQFRNAMDTICNAFAGPTSAAITPDLGREVIFVVSLPRSGSTLVEQILAAHPDVEGASELNDIEEVIRTESLRRRIDFPAWAAAATRADWERLGRDYLARTARWRTRRPRSTDKMPGNWVFIGAIRAMLPGARIVAVRRDPLETAWSCFKQVFAAGQQFSYDLADIADYWKVHEQTLRFWHSRYPQAIREQSYETLIEAPQIEIRALLRFCGLPFDPACLDPHQAERPIRSASAAQVREPMQRSTARAALYGPVLDDLRALLDVGHAPRCTD